MDRKLKERLIGAAVLVGLGVWLIPWVLDGPPPSPDAAEVTTPELALPAGARGEPLRRETIELAAPHRAGTPSELAARDAAKTAAKAAATPAAAPDPAAAMPGGRESGAAAAASPDPGTAATAREEPRAATPARAEPAPTAAQPAADPESGWMVQLGSFGDEANARRQADRVEAFGHDARIYPFTAGGRRMYRVRVGSFPTRARAEATASAIAAHGFPAQVVVPE